MTKINEQQHITRQGVVKKNPVNKDKLLKQFDKVRMSGETNMLDRNGVMRAAFDRNLYELVNHLEEIGKQGYAQFVMVDFSVWLEKKIMAEARKHIKSEIGRNLN
jgi:hypothetical protein|tara:strand:- start:240 stop:554 length:315 start_codon:yes stop_codon:yes gene_type:complete